MSRKRSKLLPGSSVDFAKQDELHCVRLGQSGDTEDIDRAFATDGIVGDISRPSSRYTTQGWRLRNTYSQGPFFFST